MTKPLDAKKIAELVDRFAPTLEVYAAQWSESPEDCVQEAFVGLSRQLVEPDNSAAWLFRAVRNRALNEHRSRRRRKSHEQRASRNLDGRIDDPAAILANEDERKRLLRVLDQLPPDSRELIVLRIWSGLSWAAIAGLTGGSSSSAQRQYVAALRKMKNLLEVPCLTKPE